MPIQSRPDWRKVAEAHNVELNDTQRERLEALSRGLLGLRGLIDWTEEPVNVFSVEQPRPLPPGGGQEPL